MPPSETTAIAIETAAPLVLRAVTQRFGKHTALLVWFRFVGLATWSIGRRCIVIILPVI